MRHFWWEEIGHQVVGGVLAVVEVLFCHDYETGTIAATGDERATPIF